VHINIIYNNVIIFSILGLKDIISFFILAYNNILLSGPIDRRVKKLPVVFLFLALFLLLTNTASASALKIENLSKYTATSDSYAILEFDVYMENSWRDAPDVGNPSANYDAIWVFIKYSTDSGSTWSHGTLSESGTNPTDFDTGDDGDAGGDGDKDNIEILVPDDKKGCFIQRSEAESGTLDRNNIHIVWDYGHDGVSDANAITAYVRIYVIEMIYIPEGGFFAGDGGTPSTNTRANFIQGSSDYDPWYIGGETEIAVTDTSANGYYYYSAGNTDEFSSGQDYIIPISFPKGYMPVYVMKYEITQSQYRDFLNVITPTQQATRCSATTVGRYMCSTDSATMVNRCGVRKSAATTFQCDFDNDGNYDEATDGEWIACNFLSWMDICAFADWSGLRPITELEYEKICRGKDSIYTANEYAWGSTTKSAVTCTSNDGTNSEIYSNGSAGEGRCQYNSLSSPDNGPLRVGFAAISTSTRLTSASGFYGNMELTGNVMELCVTVGNTKGTGYTGTHGDGVLSTNGNATNTDWPGSLSGEVTGATGSGVRGGSWNCGSATARLDVSDRNQAASSPSTRSGERGGRLARTAPSANRVLQ